MADKTQCLTEPMKTDILKAIDAAIICSQMKSNELKRGIASAISKPDTEVMIKTIDGYIENTKLLKNKVTEISICQQ